MKIEIPQAHGEAIAERKTIMQQMQVQYQLFAGEDQRHVKAVLKSLGHTAEDYGGYEIAKEGDHFFLVMQPKQQAMMMPPPADGVQPVNGSVQPQ